jgi:formylmethanofuran dehydrogenase subunit E
MSGLPCPFNRFREEFPEVCGEEIINEREVVRDGNVLCKACAGQSYYPLIDTPLGPCF